MPIAPRLSDSTASAHERLYRSLRTQVMHGEIPPGHPLTLRGLARVYGVSMTPAREAVRRLVAEGALALSSSGRVATPELTPERIEELRRSALCWNPNWPPARCPARISR